MYFYTNYSTRIDLAGCIVDTSALGNTNAAIVMINVATFNSNINGMFNSTGASDT